MFVNLIDGGFSGQQCLHQCNVPSRTRKIEGCDAVFVSTIDGDFGGQQCLDLIRVPCFGSTVQILPQSFTRRATHGAVICTPFSADLLFSSCLMLIC